MPDKIENIELVKFYITLQQDIRSEQLTEDGGGTLEQLFTQYAASLLAEAGESENLRIAYDEKVLKTGVQHKINAYSVADNYETLDLVISIYNGTDEISTITKSEIDRASKRISNFFRNAIYKDYVTEVEESSEIFQLAHTLADSKELKDTLVRVNAIIITDGLYSGTVQSSQTIYDYPIYYRIVDLNYLYNISKKTHIPIEIDFYSDGFLIPCISSTIANEQYQSYLAIISGDALVNIYERFGARLLEQNVRSFLQFSGKVNSGIRRTIINEPHMFLAYNNGITATADSIETVTNTNKNGFYIAKVNDLQIVNGGQTTASIYHTWKKDKKDVSGIQVQLKLSVIKDKNKFSSIVSNIAEYANTQNKISISDLSSNTPFHIELEKLSRSIWAPPSEGQSIQTRWFYERARGQFKNARIKEGFTKAKQKAFDFKNPRSQMFTKEDLAKFINAYEEVVNGKKILIGPHYVVRGNQKNYLQFINENLPTSVNSIYFEDLIAKAILFKSAEKKYGVKPNSIGDMRYITVPYTIAYLNCITKARLDLYKIWKRQSISPNLVSILYNLMIQIESYIKRLAPGALYGEWAKKEDCWISVKGQVFEVNLDLIQDDLVDSEKYYNRKPNEMSIAITELIDQENEKVKSIPNDIWFRIEEWGKTTGLLTLNQQAVAFSIPGRLRNNRALTNYERNTASKIIDIVIEYYPELLWNIEENDSYESKTDIEDIPINLDLVRAIVAWDKKNKRLKGYEFRYMQDIIDNKKSFGEQAKRYTLQNLKSIEKYGFKYKK